MVKKVINPLTGRKIQVGGKTYKKVFAQKGRGAVFKNGIWIPQNDRKLKDIMEADFFNKWGLRVPQNLQHHIKLDLLKVAYGYNFMAIYSHYKKEACKCK